MPALMRIPTIAMFLALSGCSAVDEPTAPSVVTTSVLDRDATAITISPSPAYAEVGESQQFRVQARDPRGNPVSGPVTWSSSDPSVATIDRAGLAMARKAGFATIKAAVQNYVATAVIQVFDLSRIAWTRDDQVFVMTGLGANPTALTTGYGIAAEWSPDGTRLVYQGAGGLWVMNGDGSGQTKITDSNLDVSPIWSPTGTTIAFLRFAVGGGNKIMTVGPNGSGLKQLTPTPGNRYHLAWSPNGAMLAFDQLTDSHSDIYVVNADGWGLTNLTANSGSWVEPAWSPDGSKLAAVRGSEGTSDIYVMNPDGTGKTKLTGAYSMSAQGPAWSPNGSRILFHDLYTLYAMDANGTSLVQLTTSPSYKFEASWSPDGGRIVFSEWDGNSTATIAVVTADGSKDWSLTNSLSFDDYHPRWRP